ncbi:MAG TPA: methyltransferase, FxLD system [Pseudonocardiaceae bacterium]|nr:methyltransferase, FxLD system [Pseudonocardiaceae bacterium]
MTTDLDTLRAKLAAQVRERDGARDDPVTDALRTVPRHLFLPGLPPESVYVDEAIVTKRDDDGQPISSSSQPAIMALMLDQLALSPGARVLEIGAGTGYNAALLAHLVGDEGHVVSVDIDQDVVDQARLNLTRAGYRVQVECVDGAGGFAGQAPYDRVIATVGVWDLAPAWLDQLADGGRIVVPLDLNGVHYSVAFERADGHWRSRSVIICGFMPMRGELAGPQRRQRLGENMTLTVPDGRDVDVEAVRAALAEPVSEVPTGVLVGSTWMFDGLSLWLATTGGPRWQLLAEEAAEPALVTRALIAFQELHVTAGLLDGDSVAVLVRGAGSADSYELGAVGYGTRGGDLAGQLAELVRGWDAAGRPGTERLRIDAYPMGGPTPPAGPAISKRHHRFLLSHETE